MNKRMGLSALLVLLLGLCFGAQASEKVTIYLTDALGSPVVETDSQGNVTATSAYRPYGTQVMGSSASGPGFTGHVNDADTGLVYMQARYYDPSIGRFLSVDPVAPSAGNPYEFSRYAYVNDNPVLNTDPTGANCYLGNKRSCEPVTDRPPPPPKQKPEVSPAVQRMRNTSDCGGCNQGTLSFYEGAGVAYHVTDVSLSAYVLRVPKLGHWQTGELTISRYVGATSKDLKLFGKVDKAASAFSYISIGASSYSLYKDARSGNGIGAIGSGSDLGMGLIGLTGPVGAAAATAYGATSLIIQIPAVNRRTVQPLTDLFCSTNPSCD